ncbi:MAG: class I SAM-dependent methyltransferase [Acidobacteriia bacterium]|nr:class I SAM-dependent methyltransferase [Terriglobia bacterium]
MPLRLGETRQFARVRDLLRGAAFTEPTICQRLKLTQFDRILGLTREKAVLSETPDCLDILIRLFLLRESLSLEVMRPLIPAETLEALEALGLVALDPADVGKMESPVALYPVGNLFIVSDRWFPPRDKAPIPPQDFVFPAITANTSQFLAGLSDSPCELLVDLGSGTGVGALEAARYARRTWAIDITERSTQMAEFNRRLNGLENVTVVCGDLYAPVGSLKFDRIVAHPPYMPAPKAAQIFYDGGTDGEQITRRIVEGLPQYLLPGGRLYCLTMGSDREAQPFERRIRAWLGEQEQQFDIGLIVRRFYKPGELAIRWAVKTSSGPEGASDLTKALTDLGVERMVYGWVIIQRKTDERAAFTIRREAGDQCGREEIAWLLNWETAARAPGILKLLAEAWLIANPAVEFCTVHKLKEGELVAEPLNLHTGYPFDVNCKAQPWVPYLVAQCNGKSTARELHSFCIQNELISAETPLEEFLKLLTVLISGGFLGAESPQFPRTPWGGPAAKG